MQKKEKKMQFLFTFDGFLKEQGTIVQKEEKWLMVGSSKQIISPKKFSFIQE